jgi:hypothetical protein
MPAAIVSYFGNLCAVKKEIFNPVKALMIAIVFMGMVVHPAGPEVY